MSAYPDTLLGDVAEFIMGQAPPGAECNFDGQGTIFVKAGEFRERFPVVREWTTRPLKLARSGDVLVCVVGATAGKVNLAIDCAIGRSVAAVRPDPSKLDSSYLYRFLARETEFLRQQSQGAAQGVLTRDMLANLLLPLPPLPEQRRIAAILDQADALRAKRREALVKLAEMAQAIFVEMFGDPTKNSLNLPTRPFGEICETRLGKMLDQKRQTGFHRRRYLRNANVRWFSFELSDLSEMDFNPGDRETYALRPGDLLICEGGEPGRAAVWSGEVKDCYYQKALHRARPKVGVAKSEFLAWFLWFASKGGGLKDHVTVATIAHLTKEKLDKLPVPLPDIREQEEFARRIAKLDVLRGTQNAAADQLNSLFTSLQHRAFSGTL